MLKKITDGICAGIMIAVGCSVFLACENRYVGATLFSIALLTICMRGYSLYTGKIGFIAVSHTKEDISTLLLGLCGNAVSASLMSLLGRLGLPTLGEAAERICSAKLEQTLPQTFIRGVFCGILMYVAVVIFRENKSSAGIFFAIPTFILSGFEHSIADIGYFAYAGELSLSAFVFIIVVLLGNSVGSLLLPVLQRLGATNEIK